MNVLYMKRCMKWLVNGSFAILALVVIALLLSALVRVSAPSDQAKKIVQSGGFTVVPGSSPRRDVTDLYRWDCNITDAAHFAFAATDSDGVFVIVDVCMDHTGEGRIKGKRSGQMT